MASTYPGDVPENQNFDATIMGPHVAMALLDERDNVSHKDQR